MIGDERPWLDMMTESYMKTRFIHANEINRDTSTPCESNKFVGSEFELKETKLTSMFGEMSPST